MRILYAEDELEMSKAVVAILKHNNYSVDAVYDGQDALDYLQSGNYDGAILDIMMPKLDGLSVLKQIRSEGNSIPVLLLTAKAEIDDRVEGLDSGADDYLPKPFAMKELLARVRAMTRRQAETTDTILTFGGVNLDRTSFMLTGKKDSVRLSNKEFQMMEMLMINPGQIISGDQFFEKIWGLDSESETNVVWVYLSYLRKKLATIDGKVAIKASRGLGYSLEEEND